MISPCPKIERQVRSPEPPDLHGLSLVVGLGVTGLSVARYLRSRGAAFRVVDSRAEPPGLKAIHASFPDVEIVCGSLGPNLLDDANRVFVSPGLSDQHPLITESRRRQLAVLNDIELFANEARAPVIAVTGSNGKSTVVTMVAEMLAAQGLNAPAGGNLAPAALDLLAVTDADAYVLEISSFQMETVQSLRPLAAAVLNVSADHLDRHGSIERYAALKKKLLRSADLAVVNWDDPLVRSMPAAHQCTIRCSVLEPLPSGYALIERGGSTYLARDNESLISVDELAIAGRHNQLNALAALALAEALDRDRAAAVDVLRNFRGLPHRCEVVGERRGVRYINDSKATNVGAAIAALNGLTGPIVLIAGGDSKGADLTPLAASAAGKLKAAVVLGASAAELARTLTPICATKRAGSMSEAVALASQVAASGDTVLLSPACSSLDMFSDYRQRGDAFVTAVQELSA